MDEDRFCEECARLRAENDELRIELTILQDRLNMIIEAARPQLKLNIEEKNA